MDITTIPLTRLYRKTGQVLDQVLSEGTLYVTDYYYRSLVLSITPPEHGTPIELPSAVLRNSVREITQRARGGGEVFAITRHGRIVAYLWGWKGSYPVESQAE